MNSECNTCFRIRIVEIKTSQSNNVTNNEVLEPAAMPDMRTRMWKRRIYISEQWGRERQGHKGHTIRGCIMATGRWQEKPWSPTTSIQGCYGDKSEIGRHQHH